MSAAAPDHAQGWPPLPFRRGDDGRLHVALLHAWVELLPSGALWLQATQRGRRPAIPSHSIAISAPAGREC